MQLNVLNDLAEAMKALDGKKNRGTQEAGLPLDDGPSLNPFTRRSCYWGLQTQLKLESRLGRDCTGSASSNGCAREQSLTASTSSSELVPSTPSKVPFNWVLKGSSGKGDAEGLKA